MDFRIIRGLYHLNYNDFSKYSHDVELHRQYWVYDKIANTFPTPIYYRNKIFDFW